MDEAAVEMPRYKCHKEVWALKISRIEGHTLVPLEKAYAPFEVSREYMYKHQPEPGGYYVVYEDGYKSYSPAGPFEKGYTLIR